MRSKNPKKPIPPLGSQAYAAIAAIEGLKMSADGRLRADKARKANLSPDQRRAEIDRAFPGKPSKTRKPAKK